MNIRPDNGDSGEYRGSQTTYPNSLIDQLAGLFQLLRGASDGEDAHVGVGVGRRVSLQLHVGTRLLFDVLDGFSTWKIEREREKKKTIKKIMEGLKKKRTDYCLV